MAFNIDFDFATVIYMVIFLVFLKIQYSVNSKINRVFFWLTCSVLFAAVMDMITKNTINHAWAIPLWCYYLLNIIYCCSVAFTSYMLTRYIARFFASNDTWWKVDFFNHLLLILFSLLALMTPFTKAIFYFDADRHYYHGPLYLLLYAVPMYFTLFSLIRVLAGRKSLKKREVWSVVSFVAVVEVFIILQMLVFQNVSIIYFACGAAIMILLFSMETPDYIQLTATLSALEKAQRESEEAKDAAIAANHAKSAFLANMSHEIRTPINGILGIGEIALRDVTDPQMREYLLDIQLAGQNLLSIVNEILDFSKIESGKMAIVPVEYQLSSTIYSIYNLIQVQASGKNLSFEVSNNPAIPNLLYGDELRIRQIMINLLNNAVKYTDSGSVSLTIDWIPEGTGEMSLVITVKDTGIGISEEDQAKLFDAYKRVNMGHNKYVQGTGLGLRITKQLVELMEGSIELHSVCGEGSEFRVVIPQKIRDAREMGIFSPAVREQAAREAKPAEVFEAPGARILIVDDVRMNIKVMEGLLKTTKMEIDAAGSGAECLEMVKKRRYDLIFLDHMMSEMDGVETLHHMKEMTDSPNAKTPVIALTANAIQGAEKEYLELGFDGYLSKPILFDQLIGALRKYL